MPRATLTLERPVADDLAARLEALEFSRPGLDVEAALATAIGVERDAEALGDEALRQRARLVQGDMHERLGRLPTAYRMVMDVNQWAERQNSRPLQARSHLVLSRVHHHLGDAAVALEHALSAVDLLDDWSPQRMRLWHLIRLADSLGSAGSKDAARERYEQAFELAVAMGDVERQVTVLNNLAYEEYECGEPHRALAVIERLKIVAEEHDWRLDPYGLDTIARIEIALGRFPEAVRTIGQCIDDCRANSADVAVEYAEFLLTQAVAERGLGALDRAQDSLDRSLAICDEKGFAETRVRVQEEQAELWAVQGDYQRAYALHKVFHAESDRLRSRQREAQANTRQAIFETAEARRDAERFRDQALRDPLTRLPNRRFADERLPALLAEAERTEVALSVAVVDLDHFKRINDTRSHAIGDQVLVAVADLLATGTAGLAEGAFAARMGGEEFLVVMPATTRSQARRYLESLRATIAAHPWDRITAGLPVTASIGGATNPPGSQNGHAALIAHADRNLYAAKDAGRNRVVNDALPRKGRRRHRDAASSSS